jgi:hypothetical protein
MKFDKRILDLSKTIYQTSVMCHESKQDPTKQIDKIKTMIREFIRLEVVPYELTEQEKTSFIIENELKIVEAVRNGHKPCDNDEFSQTRTKINKYRKDLKLI